MASATAANLNPDQAMIHIDGTIGEGGGQIVRTALALSLLTGRSFAVKNIRAGRPQPGLKAQHLTAVRALEDLSDSKATGAAIGATSLQFVPGSVRPGSYFFDIGTAGSISLLLQALLPPLLFASGNCRLVLRGGTCGKGQPSIDYLQQVLFPYLNKMAKIELDLHRHGFYPKGGGKVEIRISPYFSSLAACQSLPPFRLDHRPGLRKIKGVSFAAEALHPAKVAERQARAAALALSGQDYPPPEITAVYSQTLNPGSGIVLWAVLAETPKALYPFHIGAEALGQRGKPAETVGQEAAANLIRNLSYPAPVDPHLADQLIPFLAFIPGSVMVVPFMTDHLHSNIYVTELFLPVRFTISGNLIEVQKSN